MSDFYQFLRDDTSPTTSALLREISEELSMQGIMPEVRYVLTSGMIPCIDSSSLISRSSAEVVGDVSSRKNW